MTSSQNHHSLFLLYILLILIYATYITARYVVYSFMADLPSTLVQGVIERTQRKICMKSEYIDNRKVSIKSQEIPFHL